jgi:hypothetical protein
MTRGCFRAQATAPGVAPAEGSGYVEVFTLKVGESLCCFATEPERDDALSDWSEREKDKAHRGRILVRYKDWEAAIKEWNDRETAKKLSRMAPGRG